MAAILLHRPLVGMEGADPEFALSLGSLPLQVAKVFASRDPELASMLKRVRVVRDDGSIGDRGVIVAAGALENAGE